MLSQRVIMVRPAQFEANRETMGDNVFQQPSTSNTEIAQTALHEFDQMIEELSSLIDVKLFQDPGDTYTPDSIFPNNWFSTHTDGTLIIYPMMSENRRKEKRSKYLDELASEFDVREVCDLSYFENKGLFLEGTGSMVLDRENKVAFVCRSERSSEVVLNEFCDMTGFSSHVFDARVDGKMVYHTNVVMSVGSSYVIACTDIIEDKTSFRRKAEECGKSLIEISEYQLKSFLGNCLEVQARDETPTLILSSSAFETLSEEQKNSLSNFVSLLPISIPTIEKYGGGSVRCMIAENYLQKKNN